MSTSTITFTREQQRAAMNRMSQRMLEGWTLVQRHCPRCTTALLRNPLGELACAACEA